MPTLLGDGECHLVQLQRARDRTQREGDVHACPNLYSCEIRASRPLSDSSIATDKKPSSAAAFSLLACYDYHHVSGVRVITLF